MSTAIDEIIRKLEQLPPDRIAVVANFVDFIADREKDRGMVRAAQAAVGPALTALWSNDADAAYDRL